MRFMMLMIARGYENAAPGTMPDDIKALDAMMAYNHLLAEAGVPRAGDGLHPPSMGARVSFKGGEAIVMDGPFAEAKEVIGGYWIIESLRAPKRSNGPKAAPAPTTKQSRCARFRKASDWPEPMRAQGPGMGQTQATSLNDRTRFRARRRRSH